MKLADSLKAKRTEELFKARAIVSKAETENREFTAEESKTFAEHRAKASLLESQVKQLDGLDAEEASLDRIDKSLATPADPADPAAAFPARQVTGQPVRSSVGRLRNFKSKEAAYRFGMWFVGALAASTRDKVGPFGAQSLKFCKEAGIPLSLGTEGVNSDGGYLVPEEFSPDIIDLREVYGILRRYAKIEPMASEVKNVPIRTGGLTAYLTGEGNAGSESTKTWGQAKLVAKKLMVLTRMTSELNEDALVNFADDLAGEIAYAFAYSEDLAGFVGDGTSTYYGVSGLAGTAGKLLTPATFGQSSLTIANIASLYVGTGNAYSELILKDFQALIALLPQYADNQEANWYVHRSFFFNVMQPLIQIASGGLSLSDLQQGGRVPMFLGYPVVFTQAMPKTEANSQICAILGNMRMGMMLGDRRKTRISFSEEASVGGQSMWERDEIGVKGTERIDINFHSPGNYSATASARVAGPLVGLITAAS